MPRQQEAENGRHINRLVALFARPNLQQAYLQMETPATSLREAFVSGSMPLDMEQVEGEPALYLLLDRDGSLLQAAGTRELFWERWEDIGRGMKPDAAILESGGSVMIIAKVFANITSS